MPSHTAQFAQPVDPHPPAGHHPPAPGIGDPLLWRLATQVAAAHRPDGTGRCHNLQCRDENGPCTPWRAAQRALELAIRTDTARPNPAAPDHAAGRAVGRARARGGDGFAAWPSLQRTPGRRHLEHPRDRPALVALPRRVPGATLRAA
jgi:hypothetical protein